MGPNGAGKTTSFRMACGLTDPDRGAVYLNGLNVTDWPMYRRAREGGMGYLAQEQSIFRDPECTGQSARDHGTTRLRPADSHRPL